MLDTLKDYRKRVNSALDEILPPISEKPSKLHEALRYMVLNGHSKRIRPALVYIVGDTLGGDPEILNVVASSIEMIHVFSLIHDDLPCIDNSDLRHHKPSCHVAFDEATATLAGDYLLSLALKNLINNYAPFDALILITHAITEIIKGEYLDINLTTTNNIHDIKFIYQLKTSSLLKASLQASAIASGHQDEKLLNSLGKFADNIGLAFQIVDDILDIEQTTETLGKPQANDIDRNKSTYPSLLGLDASKQLVKTLHTEAIESIRNSGYELRQLEKIANFIVHRTY
jgi:farnesyl diphosphate synthase